MISAATLIIVIATIVIFGGGTIPALRMLHMIEEDDKVFISKTAQQQEEEQSLLVRRDSDLHPDYAATHKATPKLASQNWFERLDQKVLLPFFRSDNARGPESIPEGDESGHH